MDCAPRPAAPRSVARQRREIEREPGAGELYVAHVLGASGAAELIRLVAEDPDAKAEKHFRRILDGVDEMAALLDDVLPPPFSMPRRLRRLLDVSVTGRSESRVR